MAAFLEARVLFYIDHKASKQGRDQIKAGQASDRAIAANYFPRLRFLSLRTTQHFCSSSYEPLRKHTATERQAELERRRRPGEAI